MAAILVSTLPVLGSLGEALEEARAAHELEAVAAGAPYVARLPFGVVAVDTLGRATTLDVIARGASSVVVV